MTEKVNPVLQAGQKLIDGTGQKCTGCSRELADGEQAVCTRPSWPDTRRPATLICAACYVPPPPPGRNERFTDEGLNKGSLTSWK